MVDFFKLQIGTKESPGINIIADWELRVHKVSPDINEIGVLVLKGGVPFDERMRNFHNARDFQRFIWALGRGEEIEPLKIPDLWDNHLNDQEMIDLCSYLSGNRKGLSAEFIEKVETLASERPELAAHNKRRIAYYEKERLKSELKNEEIIPGTEITSISLAVYIGLEYKGYLSPDREKQNSERIDELRSIDPGFDMYVKCLRCGNDPLRAQIEQTFERDNGELASLGLSVEKVFEILTRNEPDGVILSFSKEIGSDYRISEADIRDEGLYINVPDGLSTKYIVGMEPLTDASFNFFERLQRITNGCT